MTNGFKRVVAGTRALESRLAGVFEKAAQTVIRPGEPQPLELIEQATDAVARHVQASGRGRYVFPYNAVTVTFVAASDEAQVRFETLCAGPPTLQERIDRRLTSAGCAGAAAADVDVHVAFTVAPDPAWTTPGFGLSLARVDAESRPPRTPAVRIDLIVTHGTADRGAYTFTSTPIAIGRGSEVRDSRNLLLRINHVAFVEGADEITQSVSRRHARIEIDAATGRPRIIDDNSAQGTSVIRHGRGIAVPRGSRGLGLQPGDEIVLGQARMRVSAHSR